MMGQNSSLLLSTMRGVIKVMIPLMMKRMIISSVTLK